MQATSNVEDRTDYDGGTVRVEPAGIDIEVEPEETLMEAADRAGYDWPTFCHMQCLCSECYVEVKAGSELCSSVAPQEAETLADNDRPDGARLACQLLVNGDVTVYRDGAPHLPRR
jgi:2Fe-2S ferredoxin